MCERECVCVCSIRKYSQTHTHAHAHTHTHTHTHVIISGYGDGVWLVKLVGRQGHPSEGDTVTAYSVERE